MWDRYESVTTLAEALSLLNEYGETARVIAGGTDIIIEMEQGKRSGVSCLIDITRVPGLDVITLDEDGIIHLGPLVTHNHIVGSELVVERGLPLALACWEVGAPQIRNRATVAGNLITGSPANDTIAPLLAMNAAVTLTSVEGERVVPLADFYTGLRRSVMAPNEMLTEITFPALKPNERGVFLKLGLRRTQAISVVNAAVVLRFSGEVVEAARISLGSVAPTVIRVGAAEEALVGRTLNEETIREVARVAASVPQPIKDVRSTAEYRSEMVKVLVARALRILAAGEEASSFPQDPAMLWGAHQARVNGNGLASPVEHQADSSIVATINGKSYSVATGQDKTLLDWLREDVGLTGSKEGCAEGECGACTVYLDGAAVMACMVPAPRAHGASIVTIEGLCPNDELHPIQQAFVNQAAVQCGYCTPGFVMAGAKLIEEHPDPTNEQIHHSISGNLCRCTGYYAIINAVKEAATLAKQASQPVIDQPRGTTDEE
ncbi:FAD binding domain-containing protein [Phototrophicus methaneseepsis]|uniref:FAD binding domain-containing protein n=1 Tax=Phototrophicus methaneseepsis TaxID=2710758 RepID=A0A7S8E6Z2_9CHLR|nr:FAD binding domain-containing protein [Phototrophicus methaneseepsis]QPC81487.1 FAD binding domain-containing protein [Phototrophicus methaneseepsis]